MATVDQEFTLLPLQMDPSSKAISCPSLPNDDALTTALTGLNNLHRTLLTLPNTTPPPPVPANPKRSAQINKMREQANTTMKKAANNPSQAQGMLCAWFDFFFFLDSEEPADRLPYRSNKTLHLCPTDRAYPAPCRSLRPPTRGSRPTIL